LNSITNQRDLGKPESIRKTAVKLKQAAINSQKVEEKKIFTEGLTSTEN
jgi:hypothetical protein